MRAALHLICVLLISLAAAPARAQQATDYTVFLQGTPVGAEHVTVAADATGTTITSDARFSPPLNITVRSAEIRYAPDWTPVSLAAEGSFSGREARIQTAFQDRTATTQGDEGGKRIAETHDLADKVILLPNGVFAGYAALARRLATDRPGIPLRGFVPPQLEFPIRVTAVENEQMQVGTDVFPVRRYELLFGQPTGDLAATLTATPDGELVRLTVPAQSLELVRSDLASPTSRSQVYSNPGDEAVIIPLEGFNLGATITVPVTPSAASRPAIVLLGPAGVNDRDGVTFGVPTLGQLAGALADAGFIAIRFDKRGYGQSGGRSESATLSDQAEDARAVARWLSDRKDVDDRRIGVIGYGEGAMVALVAASRDRRFAAVATIAAAGTSGADQFLEQQQLAAEAANVAPAERDRRLALQRQLQQAVLTGKGWDGVPDEVRREADTPWFQSLLEYDPAKVLEKVRQPLLIVHGQIDREVPVSHAERLADLARRESKSKSVEVVIVRGVNHLLVPAVTGATSEYGTLTDRRVSRDVTMTITDWLTRTLPAPRR